MKVWVYVDTGKQVGDRDHLKVFASQEAALAWFELNDPKGAAFEYEVRSSGTTSGLAHERFEQQVSRILSDLKRTTK